MSCSNPGESRAIIKMEAGLLWWKWERQECMNNDYKQNCKTALRPNSWMFEKLILKIVFGK